jgi:hypothetical protein
MWIPFLALALQLPAAPDTLPPPPDVGAVVRLFVEEWRNAWADTQVERARRTYDGRTEGLRASAAHCHSVSTPLGLNASIIRGRTFSQAACPLWYPRHAPRVDDERRSLDGGLSPDRRPRIQRLRAGVRTVLDSAARLLPDDVGFAQLRVRFALDAGDVAGAWSVASACTADPTACGLLRGLVLHRAGDPSAADSTFLAAARTMPEGARCAWNDVGVLLEREARGAYERLSCAERAEWEARLWWLADPLYLEPGNERRAEHFARKVYATLLDGVTGDERQHREPMLGGEAVAERNVRYGWPSQFYWPGWDLDRAHGEWLLARGARLAPPYVVAEYTRDRLHTLPSAAALQAPLQAAPDAWRLHAPGDDEAWWPVEHYARDRSRLVQLPVGQMVMLRREEATRFVWAGDLEAATLARSDGGGVQATLFRTRAPSDVSRVDSFAGEVGRPLLVHARLPQGPTLVGIESPGDTARAAARTRFAVDVPPPLRALGGRRALSQPLLFDPPSDAAPPVDADEAITRMYGTTSLVRPRRVGVYWESYGFVVDDTVDVEVRLTQQDRPGAVERLLVRLTGRDDGETVGARWREVPGTSRAVHVMEGGVPVQMRSIVLDVGRLPRGRYALTLTMRGARAGTATSERALAIR